MTPETLTPETFAVIDGYDRSKNPKTLTIRKCTLEDIKAMANGDCTSYLALDRMGKARHVRANGKLKTWKRDSNRFERSFKYDMYENLRLDTQGMLSTLVFEVEA